MCVGVTGNQKRVSEARKRLWVLGIRVVGSHELPAVATGN